MSRPERAPVPEFSPEKAHVTPFSPERAPVSTSCSERDSVLKCSPVVPLSVALPMLGVTIWCVWAPHTSAERLTNARPPACPCLLHLCHLAAPLLTLSPPSVQSELCGSAILHCHRGWRIPCLLLQPLRLGLRLSLSTQQLHHCS